MTVNIPVEILYALAGLLAVGALFGAYRWFKLELDEVRALSNTSRGAAYGALRQQYELLEDRIVSAPAPATVAGLGDLRSWCENIIEALDQRQLMANVEINRTLDALGASLTELNKHITPVHAPSVIEGVPDKTLQALAGIPLPPGEPHFEGLEEHVRAVKSAQKRHHLPLFDDTPSAALTPEERKLRRRMLHTLDASPDNACIKCEHWDHALGQDSLGKHPAFMEALKHIPPNAMAAREPKPSESEAFENLPEDENGYKIFPEGTVAEKSSATAAFEERFNTWELYGACLNQEMFTNAVDTCQNFRPRS